MSVMQATDDSLLGQTVSIKGWVRTKRGQKAFSFVEVNDGSCMKGVQVKHVSSILFFPCEQSTLKRSQNDILECFSEV